MKLIKDVVSTSRPLDIDDTSSNTTIYVRENIREEIKIDPIFDTETILYIYDEKQFTTEEWYKIVSREFQEKDSNMQEQIDITQISLSEVLMMISGIFEIMVVDDNSSTFEKHTSAIIIMYASMIKRGLITIESVPDMFRDRVQSTLDKYSKEEE